MLQTNVLIPKKLFALCDAYAKLPHSRPAKPLSKEHLIVELQKIHQDLTANVEREQANIAPREDFIREAKQEKLFVKTWLQKLGAETTE